MSSISCPRPIYLHDTLPSAQAVSVIQDWQATSMSSISCQSSKIDKRLRCDQYPALSPLIYMTPCHQPTCLSYHTTLSKWYPALGTSIYTIPYRPVSHPPLTSYFDVIDTRFEII